MKQLLNDFSQPFDAPWRVTEIGQGKVRREPRGLRLAIPAAADGAYHDAQLTNFDFLRNLTCRPPLRMTVQARVETPSLTTMVGTAGFGLWNHPYLPEKRGYRLPQTAWFFFSAPPSNMQLAQGVPGPGWKAATLDARRWQFLALAPTAPVGFLLMRSPALYRRLWPVGQRAVGVSERLLDTALLAQTHTYTLDWEADHLSFEVDGETVLTTPSAPGGPMGFIAWVDNQYAIVTPQGRLGWGLIDVPQEQALVIEMIEIEDGQ